MPRANRGPSYITKEERFLYSLAMQAKKTGLIKTIPDFINMKRPLLISQRGKMGTIQVLRSGQVKNTGAAKFVKTFTKKLGGKEEAMLALSAVEDKLSPPNRKVLEALRVTEGPESLRGLPYIIAACKAEPVSVVKAIIEGMMVIGKAEALGELAINQGAIMRDLLRHAMDQTTNCKGCLGLGMVPKQPNQKLQEDGEGSEPCPVCSGSGKIVTSSEHKEWAMKKALEISELGPQKKGVEVNVNTAIGVRVEGAASQKLAQLAKVSDEILFKSKDLADIQDAEILSKDEILSEEGVS